MSLRERLLGKPTHKIVPLKEREPGVKFVTRRVSARSKAVRERVDRKGRYESSQGVVSGDTRWTDRRPHPANMGDYEKLNADGAVNTAITILAGMLAGVGCYTEMPEDYEPDHPNKKKIDEYNEAINLDEKLYEIARLRYEWGFCPVERLDEDLKMLPPETFYVWQRPTGEIYRYSQEVNSQTVASWEKSELGDIIRFVHKETPSNPYGQALVETVAERVDMRNQMAEDVPEVVHKYAYPFRHWEADDERIMKMVETEVEEKEPDEDLFFYNIQEGQLRKVTETLAHRVGFDELITHNDEQIAEGLFAPLILYLRNATEASATTMMEAVDRRIQFDQQYFKRRVERFIFKPICGDPVPRLMFGAPKTGLEDITLTDIGALYQSGAIRFNQAQHIVRQVIPGLPEIEEPQEEPAGQRLPLMKVDPSIDLELYVFEKNFTDHRITMSEALKEASRIIGVYMDRNKQQAMRNYEESTGKRVEKLSPESEEHFKLLRFELFNAFKNRLLNTGMKQ